MQGYELKFTKRTQTLKSVDGRVIAHRHGDSLDIIGINLTEADWNALEYFFGDLF